MPKSLIPRRDIEKLKSLGSFPIKVWGKFRSIYAKNPGAPGEAFKRCVASVSSRGGAYDPRAVCASAGRKKYGKRKFQAMAAAGRKRKNPEETAADAYREFHGKDAEEIFEFTEPRHEHEYYAGIGKLVKLKVKPINGGEVILAGFKGAMLAENEKKTQLFIVGGDQSVDLKQFGISHTHEKEVLGEVKSVEYDTEKRHLVDGGKAIYHHKFGGKRSRLPVLLYDARNKQLEFAGGGYTIPAEGIRG